MNALRFYIRQSLMLEAIGQDTWIRTARPVIASEKGFEPEATGEADSRFVSALTSGVKGFWAAGTTAYRSRGGAGLMNAGKAAWGNATLRKGAAVAGVGSVAWHLANKNQDANDETKKQAIERVDQFYDFMLKKTTAKSNQIKISLQTKDLATNTESLDKKLTLVDTNYNTHTANLVSSTSYEDFFTKFPAYRSAIKDSFDTEITKISGTAEADTKLELQKFAYSFLLVHCADMMLVAIGDDTELLERDGLETDQAGKERIQNTYETSFQKIANDPEVKKAKTFVNEITGATQ